MFPGFYVRKVSIKEQLFFFFWYFYIPIYEHLVLHIVIKSTDITTFLRHHKGVMVIQCENLDPVIAHIPNAENCVPSAENQVMIIKTSLN